LRRSLPGGARGCRLLGPSAKTESQKNPRKITVSTIRDQKHSNPALIPLPLTGDILLNQDLVRSQIFDRTNPVPINLGGYRSLEQTNRNYQAEFTLHQLKNAFYTLERSLLNDNLLADLEKRPRRNQQTRLRHRAYVLYFVLRDRRRSLAETNQTYNARSRKDWQAMFDIEAAKNVSRKQKLIETLPAVGPLPISLIARCELLVTPLT